MILVLKRHIILKFNLSWGHKMHSPKTPKSVFDKV